ncbi:hypothetical protein FCV25MIE_19456 [Fagus crenata]
MIHPVLSTSCGSEASPPHVPIHGSKPSTTHSSGYRSKRSRAISDAKQGTLFDIGLGLVPLSLKPNFERASSMGWALPYKEISLLYRWPPRMDEAGLKLSSGSNEQATLVPMIHSVLSTSCGSKASPPHVPIHGSKPSTTHSSGYR